MPDPLRVRHWAALDANARNVLLARQTGRIFDPELREGVLRIIEDVREHGDEAIVRALRDFDGCEVAVDALRVDAGRDRERARGDPRAGRAGDPPEHLQRPPLQRARARGRGLAHRARARPRARRAHDADRERRPVRPERQGIVPVGAHPDRDARRRRRGARDRGRRATAPGAVGPGRSCGARRRGRARAAQHLPRERPRGRRRARVRHGDDPAGAQGARARAARPCRPRRSRCSATAASRSWSSARRRVS